MTDGRGRNWIVNSIGPHDVLAWARAVADGASRTSVMLTRTDEQGPVTMDGQATVLHHDVTDVGTFTVLLWGDRPSDGRPGGDYVVRQHIPPNPLRRPRPMVEVKEQRPRLRVLDAFADRYPVLVIDRWTGDPEEIQRLDAQGIGFSGVLVFREDVDLDDDGRDAEPAAVTQARDRVLNMARDVATLHDEGRSTAAAREHLARAVAELDDLDET